MNSKKINIIQEQISLTTLDLSINDTRMILGDLKNINKTLHNNASRQAINNCLSIYHNHNKKNYDKSTYKITEFLQKLADKYNVNLLNIAQNY